MAETLISVARAREISVGAAEERRLETERIPVDQALDRVLAEEVRAAGDVPPFPCSAMDGYAVQAGPAGRRLKVAGESRAGAPSSHPLEREQAIRISTGAAVPAGADAVIRQEDVEIAPDGAEIELREAVAAGNNVRYAGEDMPAGIVALAPGTVLGVPELGVAVAAGAGDVAVSRRPRVAVLCTGDELRAPGEPLGPGEIHNSNAPMLVSLAVRCGAEAAAARRLKDDAAETERVIGAALQQADVVVISGGMSVGPHDHVKPALKSLGVQEQFWGVALQPGKPTGLGTLDRKLVFGLPGNPVSAVVTFSLFAAPALAVLQGAGPEDLPGSEHRPHGTATLATAVPRNPRRDQAMRVRLEHDATNTLAHPTGPQGSHIITSLLLADALAVIPAGDGELPAGTRIALIPLPR
jgi:molybdopterin molybdotransferase